MSVFLLLFALLTIVRVWSKTLEGMKRPGNVSKMAGTLSPRNFFYRNSILSNDNMIKLCYNSVSKCVENEDCFENKILKTSHLKKIFDDMCTEMIKYFSYLVPR